MKNSMLEDFTKTYDKFVGDINYAELPDRESEDYRKMIFETANDKIFFEGRCCIATESLLESYGRVDLNCELADSKLLAQLTTLEQKKVRFFLDLKEVCYPLFMGQEIDWTAWPWNLKKEECGLYGDEFIDFFKDCEYTFLKAAVVYDITEQIYENKADYTSVTRHTVYRNLHNDILPKWHGGYNEKPSEYERALSNEIFLFLDNLSELMNHMLVGKELGFDFMTQSIYDAIDGCIDTRYDYRGIKIARKLSQWLKDNWAMGVSHPSKEQLEELYYTFKDLAKNHNVEITSPAYSWDCLTMDVLGVDSTALHYMTKDGEIAYLIDDINKWDAEEAGDWSDEE